MTSILPKAHVLNQRAMEILRAIGIAEEIHRQGTPLEQMRATDWYAGFGGPHRNAGRRIATAVLASTLSSLPGRD